MRIGLYNTSCHLGGGTFGDVWEAHHIITGKVVALKFEQSSLGMLRHEAEVLNALRRVKTAINVLSFKNEGKYSVLVLPLLGDTVLTRFTKMARPTNADYCALEIGRSMLACIRDVHLAGFVHRDVKPDNFMYGVGSDKNNLYTIDFGLCAPLCEETMAVETKGRVGSVAFCSPYVEQNGKYTRQDDIISWFFSIAQLANGGLPWSEGIKGRAVNSSAQELKLHYFDSSRWRHPLDSILVAILNCSFHHNNDYGALDLVIKTLLEEIA